MPLTPAQQTAIDEALIRGEEPFEVAQRLSMPLAKVVASAARIRHEEELYLSGPQIVRPATPKRQGGRPKGSKNRPKNATTAKASQPAAPKSRRGRPKGSKNKPKASPQNERVQASQLLETRPRPAPSFRDKSADEMRSVLTDPAGLKIVQLRKRISLLQELLVHFFKNDAG